MSFSEGVFTVTVRTKEAILRSAALQAPNGAEVKGQGSGSETIDGADFPLFSTILLLQEDKTDFIHVQFIHRK